MIVDPFVDSTHGLIHERSEQDRPHAVDGVGRGIGIRGVWAGTPNDPP